MIGNRPEGILSLSSKFNDDPRNSEVTIIMTSQMSIKSTSSDEDRITSSAVALQDAIDLPSHRQVTPPAVPTMNSRHLVTTLLRPETPAESGLSSPPLTIANGFHHKSTLSARYTQPSPEEISGATRDDLLAMLEASVAEVARLDLVASESRMSAAHFKLQHNLLSIETEETTKRMEVEHEMTRREVDLLQHAAYDRSETQGPEFITKIRVYCETLEDENAKLQRRLKHAKKLLESHEDEIDDLKNENAHMKQRIRENREHINTMRSPGGIFHSASPKSYNESYPATPQQYTRATPKRTPLTGRSVRHGQEPFAALLLADRVLSQDAHDSQPTTPVAPRRTQLPSTPGSKHNRASHSVIPQTPRSARAPTSNTLLPSIQFTPNIASRAPRDTPVSVRQSRERRRKSRDSTISASDDEGIAHYRETEEIQQSQASQSATEMLRADPRESFDVAASRTHTPTPITEKSSLLQAKILGPVTKLPSAASDKRKRESDVFPLEYAAAAKKVRADTSPGLRLAYTGLN